eukprot:12287096-Alexandrium_andersonii.AAC.1
MLERDRCPPLAACCGPALLTPPGRLPCPSLVSWCPFPFPVSSSFLVCPACPGRLTPDPAGWGSP